MAQEQKHHKMKAMEHEGFLFPFLGDPRLMATGGKGRGGGGREEERERCVGGTGGRGRRGVRVEGEEKEEKEG